MPELIERGHIYIAQPPLYKVKRGKQETYVKDDMELNALLLKSALDGASIVLAGDDQPPLQGEALGSLCREFILVMAIIDRLSRRYYGNMLEQLISLPELTPERFSDAVWLTAWGAELAQALNAVEETVSYRIELSFADDKPQAFTVWRSRHGVEEPAELSLRFFESAEYRKLAELGNSLRGLVRPGSQVFRGEQKRDVQNFRQAMEWLMAEARKGQAIQRYKGLGEMNPEQLWETTVNPATRRLMQVRIEDAVAADEIFTTLMGDQVEPRREFIERNALAAENIDI
jgi:DNA gyrase subunit B